MDINLILEGKATIEDILLLNGLGFEFVINNGAITEVTRTGDK